MTRQRLYRIGAPIHWTEQGGAGRPTVWLPGLGLPAAGCFDAVLADPALPPLRAVLVDPPGVGGGAAPARPPRSVADMADAVADLIDHLGEAACTVIGYSLGGSVAIELACRRPDLVARLIVAEANLLPGGGGASRRIAAAPAAEFAATVLPGMIRSLEAAGAAGDPAAGFIARCWAEADPAALHAAAAALVDLPGDFLGRFLGLGLPRTFIYGETSLPGPGRPPAADAPDPDALADAGVAVAILGGVGHDLMLTNPSGFARLVAAGLGRG